MKCDNCDAVATVHLCEIHFGKKTEKHLCQRCAAEILPPGRSHPSITELLKEFVASHTAKFTKEHPGKPTDPPSTKPQEEPPE